MLDRTRETDGSRPVWRDEEGVHAIASGDGGSQPAGSLIDDITALYEDGRNYVSAELAFQKTRASYAGKKSAKAAVFGLGAFVLLQLALIALVFGLVLALETLVGPLAAGLIVTAVLLIGAGVLAYMAKNKATAISRAFTGGQS